MNAPAIEVFRDAPPAPAVVAPLTFTAFVEALRRERARDLEALRDEAALLTRLAERIHFFRTHKFDHTQPMKHASLAIALLVLAAATGCTNLNVTRTNPDGTSTSFHVTSLLSTSAIKGLKVDGTTKTTSNLLAITQGATDPNSESITASGAALGELIGTAAKTTVKP